MSRANQVDAIFIPFDHLGKDQSYTAKAQRRKDAKKKPRSCFPLRLCAFAVRLLSKAQGQCGSPGVNGAHWRDLSSAVTAKVMRCPAFAWAPIEELLRCNTAASPSAVAPWATWRNPCLAAQSIVYLHGLNPR